MRTDNNLGPLEWGKRKAQSAAGYRSAAEYLSHSLAMAYVDAKATSEEEIITLG